MNRQAAAFSDGGKLIVPRSLKKTGTLSLFVFLNPINTRVSLRKHISVNASAHL